MPSAARASSLALVALGASAASRLPKWYRAWGGGNQAR